MKVVIIGAGEQGYVLTWNLAKHPAVDQIVLGDWDVDRAEEVKAAWGAGKTTAVHVDARDIEHVAIWPRGRSDPERGHPGMGRPTHEGGP